MCILMGHDRDWGGDQLAHIWSVAPVLHLEAQGDKKRFPKLLATCSGHDGAVNCVRWSHGGYFLATASSDSFILLWRMVASGKSATPPVEQWERVMTFSGHGSDVLDVAWARDDRKIASCSVDGTVRIWEVTPETLQLRMCKVAHMTLSGHSNWVRGLAWDPVGTYLASAGDDRTVHVWRTSIGRWKRLSVSRSKARLVTIILFPKNQLVPRWKVHLRD